MIDELSVHRLMSKARSGEAPPWAAFEMLVRRRSIWQRIGARLRFTRSLVEDRTRALDKMWLAEFKLNAAVMLLREVPPECSKRAPLPGACGKCWPCRVDKFLRDAGLRR